MVDKKPFKIASLADFQWSPTDNRLAYWTAEEGNVPARLVLAEVNGVRLEEIRSKVRRSLDVLDGDRKILLLRSDALQRDRLQASVAEAWRLPCCESRSVRQEERREEQSEIFSKTTTN